MEAVGVIADRRVYEGRHRSRVREVIARTVAVVDTYLLRKEPRFLGEPIPIDEDATLTHDY